jgi:dipeptidase E
MDGDGFPDASTANIEQWAAGIPVATYGIDDETAIRVTDGTVEVVSEGHWRLFAPGRKEGNRNTSWPTGV